MDDFVKTMLENASNNLVGSANDFAMAVQLTENQPVKERPAMLVLCNTGEDSDIQAIFQGAVASISNMLAHLAADEPAFEEAMRNALAVLELVGPVKIQSEPL